MACLQKGAGAKSGRTTTFSNLSGHAAKGKQVRQVVRLAELHKVHPRVLQHTPENKTKSETEISQWQNSGRIDSDTVDTLLQMLLQMKEEKNDG